jgi:hypothetical protein
VRASPTSRTRVARASPSTSSTSRQAGSARSPTASSTTRSRAGRPMENGCSSGRGARRCARTAISTCGRGVA